MTESLLPLLCWPLQPPAASIEDDIIRCCFVLGLKINLSYHLQYLGNSDDNDFMITLIDGIGYHLFSVSSRFDYLFKKNLIKLIQL